MAEKNTFTTAEPVPPRQVLQGLEEMLQKWDTERLKNQITDLHEELEAKP